VVSAGIMLGALTLWLVNAYVPHEHFILGREGGDTSSLQRIWLFVIAITLHNFPRAWRSGSATERATSARPTRSRSASACRTCRRGWPSRWRWSARLSALAGLRGGADHGLVEPVGGLLGVTAVTIAQPLLPWALAFAAGAMIFVISSEIIPETHRKGAKIESTFGLMIGFVIMMTLDVVLG
jgi:ZIP family zinc transporter